MKQLASVLLLAWGLAGLAAASPVGGPAAAGRPNADVLGARSAAAAAEAAEPASRRSSRNRRGYDDDDDDRSLLLGARWPIGPHDDEDNTNKEPPPPYTLEAGRGERGNLPEDTPTGGVVDAPPPYVKDPSKATTTTVDSKGKPEADTAKEKAKYALKRNKWSFRVKPTQPEDKFKKPVEMAAQTVRGAGEAKDVRLYQAAKDVNTAVTFNEDSECKRATVYEARKRLLRIPGFLGDKMVKIGQVEPGQAVSILYQTHHLANVPFIGGLFTQPDYIWAIVEGC